jgi:hypothetical protein
MIHVPMEAHPPLSPCTIGRERPRLLCGRGCLTKGDAIMLAFWLVLTVFGG